MFQSMIIVAGFVIASSMIVNMVQDWEDNPTITTLDSIATPIKEIQFPTVTVCPEMLTLPDNWALPEIILNAIPFECYTNGYPPCNATFQARKDFGIILEQLAEHLKKQVVLNDKMGMPFTKISDGMVLQSACFLKENNLSVANFTDKFIENFGRQSSLQDFLWEIIGDYDNSSCCDQDNQFCDDVRTQLIVGDLFLSTNINMPLGRLLMHFVNLTSSAQTFDHTKGFQDLTRLGSDWCSKLGVFDWMLHDIFSQWSKDLGLSRTVSLFELPAMLALVDVSRWQTVTQLFPFGLCSHNIDIQESQVICWDLWLKYIQGETEHHPCNVTNNQGPCCHYWTKQMDNNLNAIMTVMKLATGRGQNLFDVQKTLQPFRQSKSRYSHYFYFKYV